MSLTKSMKRSHLVFGLVGLVILGLVGVAALGIAAEENSGVPASSESSSQPEGWLDLNSDYVIPDLPFPTNPDPDECGIPQPWGSDSKAWLNGYYKGELIQPVVYLYDGHGRNEIVAQAIHGTEVEILMFQANPVLDYYLVEVTTQEDGQNQGWVPAPFLSRDPFTS
ncbi:MAG: hypothetical protein GYB66_08460 [Chloroflexi bacterium]|nr:hypothetical protein [Chloroflexota bacterium]